MDQLSNIILDLICTLILFIWKYKSWFCFVFFVWLLVNSFTKISEIQKDVKDILDKLSRLEYSNEISPDRRAVKSLWKQE